MAACSGIMLKRQNHNIEHTTTYGVGNLIDCALNLGVKKIIMGLGGSLTNDGGCGMATALGVRFYDAEGEAFIPTSGSLSQIKRINISNIDSRLSNVELITMCDVDNPLYGEKGAAYVFSPQKGATPSQVIKLDEGLRNLAQIAKIDLGFVEPNFKAL